MPDYLTCSQVAAEMNVKRWTVQRWIREKQLSAYKIGREYRVQPEDLQAFMEERRVLARRKTG